MMAHLKQALSSVSKNVVNQTRYKNSRALESAEQLVQNRVAISRHSLLQMFSGTRKMYVHFEVDTEVN